MFLRTGYGERLDATVEDLTEPLSAVNARLPFAERIMPGHVWRGKYFTRDIDHWFKAERRRRALDRLIRVTRRFGLYDDEF